MVEEGFLSLCLTLEVFGQSDSAEAPRGTRASGLKTGCIQLTNENGSSLWAAGPSGYALNTTCDDLLKSGPFLPPCIDLWVNDGVSLQHSGAFHRETPATVEDRKEKNRRSFCDI